MLIGGCFALSLSLSLSLLLALFFVSLSLGSFLFRLSCSLFPSLVSFFSLPRAFPLVCPFLSLFSSIFLSSFFPGGYVLEAHRFSFLFLRCALGAVESLAPSINPPVIYGLQTGMNVQTLRTELAIGTYALVIRLLTDYRDLDLNTG